ncbi:Ser/Thr protein kinase RdoA (MazF antagonist) [Paenibacillus sp. PvP094]|uniref:phosphotransferase n=1 Tax=Paenibacillus sp. PvP094 TaxID=3156394 RepID=UPI0033997BE4
MTDIDFVMELYDIGQVLTSTALQQGNSSKAILIHAASGKYVLRKLKNEHQAQAEHKLYQVLASVNISPKMLKARDGLSYIIYNHEIYNLQNYIDNTTPYHQVSIDFVQLGNVISLFHQLISHLDIPEQKDRYQLHQLWSAVSNEVKNSSFEGIRSLAEHTEQCMEYIPENNTMIHGDLGVWNMLFTKECIHVIDMGEVRRGNHHFDLAAALTSTIPSSVNERELDMIVADFECGYRNGNAVLNRKSLYQQIHIWMLRGCLAVIRERGMDSPTILYVERTIEMLNRFKVILH